MEPGHFGDGEAVVRGFGEDFLEGGESLLVLALGDESHGLVSGGLFRGFGAGVERVGDAIADGRDDPFEDHDAAGDGDDDEVGEEGDLVAVAAAWWGRGRGFGGFAGAGVHEGGTGEGGGIRFF